MPSYEDLIVRFFYEAVPTSDAPKTVQFEAVSSEVFGTKQRRYGPMPGPEAQVLVRDVLRKSEDSRALTVFVPWACSKQEPAAKLDLLEFCALRQLLCLREGMARFGWSTNFVFRVEDLTDTYLFGCKARTRIESYRDRMARLVGSVLPGSDVRLESHYSSPEAFRDTAEMYAYAFNRYLRGEGDSSELRKIGWAGDIPAEQREYYLAAYRVFYPNADHNREMAKYFAATLARKTLGATATPTDVPFVTVSFSKPVPGNPVVRPQVYYRTLAARHTHAHTAPWVGRGYFALADDGGCTPRFVDAQTPELVPHTMLWNGVEIDAPYACV